jgi:Amino acid permease
VLALGFVIAASNAAIRVLFAMSREQALPRPLARLSGRQTPVAAIDLIAVLTLALGLPLTVAYGAGSTAGYLIAAGGLAVVRVYFAGNIAVIRAFRTEFRDEFRPVPHLLIPAIAAVIFLLPLWGDHSPARLHAGEPAALHRAGLARRWPHSCQLPDAGQSFHAERELNSRSRHGSRIGAAVDPQVRAGRTEEALTFYQQAAEAGDTWCLPGRSSSRRPQRRSDGIAVQPAYLARESGYHDHRRQAQLVLAGGHRGGPQGGGPGEWQARPGGRDGEGQQQV